MLRIIQNQSSAGAKSYYSHSDYLSEGQELAGYWRGLGADRLGLSGIVEKKDFDALCDNLDPRTGEPLTARTNSDRTVGYDFNFHVPKGLSLAYALGGDERILSLVREAASETMRDVERDAKTRVRKLGKQEDRPTGNLVWAEFLHTTARPVDGVPDAHVHIHAFCFNATFDPVENRFKAAQFRDQKRDAPYYEALFHARLARSVKELGYTIERKGKFWDVAEIAPSIRKKFSRRTDQIEELARKKGIVDPEAKGELGAKTRIGKVKDLSWRELVAHWRARLTGEEEASTSFVPMLGARRSKNELTHADALRCAMDHCFEREAVIPERQLLAEALRRGAGDVTLAGIERELAPHDILRRDQAGRKFVTTSAVLAEEQAVLDFAKHGRDKCEPLQPQWTPQRNWLSDEQQGAIRQVLTSTDRVQILRGGAGTGKTTLMQETVAAIESGGHKVFPFAPSAEASRKVLRDEGFQSATTVAELLVNPSLQRQTAGQVIWIDEAGLLATRELRQVFELAKQLAARVVLSGDSKQHGSVLRGGILRILETYAGLKAATVKTIQRQQGEYQLAVSALAEGRLEEGFDRLDDLRWIREIPDQESRDAAIAADYAEALREAAGVKKDEPLVISPTHREAEHLTAAIRRRLRSDGSLDEEARTVERLIPLHLTEAQRGDSAWLEAGDVIEFHQNAAGHRKGERIVLGDVVPEELTKLAKRFSVYRPQRLELAVGERIRFTAGGKTFDGKHRINNGGTARIAAFTSTGDLVLDNGWTLGQGFGHLTHGYVQTSFSSQGRTVNKVFIAESAESFGAASREQWYVSVSRARHEARIYTSDKAALRAAVVESAAQLTASEFMDKRAQLRERTRRLLIQARSRVVAAIQTTPLMKERHHAK